MSTENSVGRGEWRLAPIPGCDVTVPTPILTADCLDLLHRHNLPTNCAAHCDKLHPIVPPTPEVQP